MGRIGDSLGRRRTILHGSLIFLVGGALQTLAGSTATMMVGRFVAGLGVGMLSTMVPVYQSEISPAHNRGRLACIEFSGNVAGYATSVWVGYVCGFVPGNFAWRAPLSLQCVGGALLALGSAVALVESPRWLLDHDRDEEGLLVIARLYASEDDEDGQAAVDVRSPQARAVFSEIKANVLLQREAEGSNGAHTYADMFQRYRKRVLIAMSAQALAQLNGINVISYYAPLVFEEAGWKGHSAVLMTGVNALMYLAATVVPWFAVDRWGRRPILLSGAMAMAASLCVISFLLYVNVASTPTLVVVFVMIYNAAFGYSWGPVPWLYPPEILPLDIRSKGASLSTATNWAFNWVVGEATPVLQEWITWRLYLLHAFWCATSFVVGKSEAGALMRVGAADADIIQQYTLRIQRPAASIWKIWIPYSAKPWVAGSSTTKRVLDETRPCEQWTTKRGQFWMRMSTTMTGSLSTRIWMTTARRPVDAPRPLGRR